MDKVLNSRKLLKAQRKTLTEFSEYQKAEDIQPKGRLEYLYTLQGLGLRVRKDFRNMTKEDLNQYIIGLREKGLAPSTLGTHITRIKRFFKWVLDRNLETGEIIDEDYPDIVKGGAFRKKRQTKGNGEKWLEPEDLLTAEEISAILEAETSPMYKALWTLLISSGGRIKREVLPLRIGDIQLEAECFYVKLQERRVMCVEGLYHVKLWLSMHPRRFEKEAWVFCSEKNTTKPLKYITVAKRLYRIAKGAGITKRVYPHLFRHTSATFYASKPGITPYMMNLRFGWQQGSRMPSRYIHLKSTDVEEHERIIFGLQPTKKLQETEKLLDYTVVPKSEFEALNAKIETILENLTQFMQDPDLAKKAQKVFAEEIARTESTE